MKFAQKVACYYTVIVHNHELPMGIKNFHVVETLSQGSLHSKLKTTPPPKTDNSTLNVTLAQIQCH